MTIPPADDRSRRPRAPGADILAPRHARIRAAFDAGTGDTPALDALIVTTPANIRYLTNHTGSAGIVVLTREAVHLLVDFRYEEAVRQLQGSASACPSLVHRPVPGSYEEALGAWPDDPGVEHAGIEASQMTVARHDWLTRSLGARGSACRLTSTQGLVEAGRMVKDSFEVAALRDSASRLAPVVDSVLPRIRQGLTERAVAGMIEGALREAGFDRPAFETIVASGPHSALPHYRAGDRSLAAGDLVVLDFGGVLDGYCCDLTRTVAIGTPSADARRVHAAVLEAQTAAITAVRPGMEAHRVDSAARSVLSDHGLGEAFGHGTGHGLGLDVHELPRITRPGTDTSVGSSASLLTPGMIFTVEPGAYLAGWGGVRIEDDVLVTESGCEVLTGSPRNLLTL